MSGSIENASASIAATQTGPGVFQYTITLTDTGTTPIGTFWFAWDDVPSQDFMSAPPTAIGAPANWSGQGTPQNYPNGIGYGLEWTANAPSADIAPGATTAAFTFTSTETPAQMAALSPFETSFQTTSSFVYAGAPFATPGGNFVVTSASQPGTGLLGALGIGQQLELIYVAYFNRAADGGGDSFWTAQNTQAQAQGQSAAMALTNIANSFEPQPETLALYPFLGTPDLNLSTQAAQAGLSAFINSVYTNMFGRAADTPGLTYWVGQITGGAVGLGAAALAIANGATGTDATELRNKITVALDFSTRTQAANLGVTAPLTPSFVAEAHSVLGGVDGSSLNDASVTAAESATTAFIASQPTGQQASVTAMSASPIITVAEPGQVIDPGAADHTIQFLPDAVGETIVPYQGFVDQVIGFDPATDVLDLGSLLKAANLGPQDVASLSRFLTITDQGGNAVVSFDPAGHGAGSVIAVLHNLGGMVDGLASVTDQGAVRVS